MCMFSYLTGQQFLLLTAGFFALYYGVIALYYRRRPQQPAFSTNSQATPNTRTAIIGNPQELIGAPAPEWEEELEMFLEPEAERSYSVEMLEDDDSILLKEAERVVEEVQDVVTQIASNPPNTEDVFNRIRAIFRQYRIFENTEYFEAINAFIAQAVERECDIKWTRDDLMVMWK